MGRQCPRLESHQRSIQSTTYTPGQICMTAEQCLRPLMDTIASRTGPPCCMLALQTTAAHGMAPHCSSTGAGATTISCWCRILCRKTPSSSQMQNWAMGGAGRGHLVVAVLLQVHGVGCKSAGAPEPPEGPTSKVVLQKGVAACLGNVHHALPLPLRQRHHCPEARPTPGHHLHLQPQHPPAHTRVHVCGSSYTCSFPPSPPGTAACCAAQGVRAVRRDHMFRPPEVQCSASRVSAGAQGPRLEHSVPESDSLVPRTQGRQSAVAVLCTPQEPRVVASLRRQSARQSCLSAQLRPPCLPFPLPAFSPAYFLACAP